MKYRNTTLYRTTYVSVVAALLLQLWSCANMAAPNGGPYDETPPRYVRSIPLPNETNYTKKKIEIEFSELIQLEKPSENIIVTPPQKSMPIIKSSGKKVIVELQDSLIPNVTYTIDFNDAIVDYTEKNPLEGFSFAFSTGETIDSMMIAGKVLDAQTLEPLKGMTVGLHANLDDTAFTNIPFIRTSVTNDKGEFRIRNVANGTYRVYALQDLNRDYKFDQPGEAIAFIEKDFTPTFESAVRYDTIWKDTLTVDTIIKVEFNHFLPDDVLLLAFKEDFMRQYMTKPDRSQPNILNLNFNEAVTYIPKLEPLNFQASGEWYVTNKKNGDKTISYWLTDTTLMNQDTLTVAFDYYMTDTLNKLVLKPDTFSFVDRGKKKRLDEEEKRRKKKRKKDEEEMVFLGMQVNAQASLDVYDTIKITFDQPIEELPKSVIHLQTQIDSVWNDVDFTLQQDTLNTFAYFVQRKWGYGESYKLTIDSASVYSIYGFFNNGFTQEFKTKAKDQYGELYINVVGLDQPAFIQLLDKSDNPVRQQNVVNGEATFINLKPDKYYGRIILDSNGDGRWNTGNFKDKLQPDTVYYYPTIFEVPQNWEIEQTWELFAVPVDKQKPMDILKNKPKEATKKKRDYKNESQTSSNNNQNTGRPAGFP